MSINATPFNPTFKLVGNLQDDQVLVYDSSEGAFINAAGGTATGTGGLDSVTNTGTGNELGSVTGSSVVLKTISAGQNVTITDNGSSLVIAADFTETFQSGTNLGTGSSILAAIDPTSGQFSFKSIAAGTGLTLADDGNTITITSSVDTSLFPLKSNNLSDLPDKAAARTNLGAVSQADGDARYFRRDAHNVPTINNNFDLGSSEFKFNDIYAETLHGTALLADNLTISGSTEGDVLTWNGTTWVAAENTGSGSGTGSTPQTLTINGQQLSISGGNTITLPSYDDVDNFVRTDGHSVPTQDRTWDIGSAEARFNDVYGETFQGTAVLADNLTIPGTQGQVLTHNGATWTAGPVTLQTLSWDGNVLSISEGNSVSLNLGDYYTKSEVDTAISNIDHVADWATLQNKPTIPSDVSDLTDTTGLLDHFSGAYGDLTGAPTIPSDVSELTDTTGLLAHVTPFSGNYDDLTNKPTLFDGAYSSLTGAPTIPTDVSQLTDTTGLLQDDDHQTLSLVGTSLAISNGNAVDLASLVNTDAQTLSLVGTALQISGGNAVDLASLQTPAPDLTPYATQEFVSNAINALSDEDSQVLSFTGTTLSISNGNAVDLASLVTTPDFTGYATETYVDNALAALTDQDEQTLSLVGTTLTISNGNSVDIADAFQETAQTLSLVGNDLSISGGNTITLPVYQDVDNYIKTDGHSAPAIDNTYDIGSAELRYNDVYGERFHGTAILADQLTVTGNDGDVLAYRNGSWVAENSPAAQSLTLDGTELQISGGNTVDLSSILPTDISELTDTTGLLGGGSGGTVYQNLTLAGNTLTISGGNSVDLAAYENVPQDFSWNSITGKPTTLSGYGITDGIPTDISQLTDSNGLLPSDLSDLTDTQSRIPTDVNQLTDSSNLLSGTPQTLTLAGTDLTISGGNTISLSSLGGGSSTVYWNDILSKPTFATVATTGLYSDLLNKPSIPTDISELTDTGGLLGAGGASTINELTDVQTSGAGHTPTDGQGLIWNQSMGHWMPGNLFSGSYNDLTDKPTIATDISQLTDTTGIIQAANTDSQTLTLVGSSLQISGGNSVDLSSISGASDWASITGTPTTLAGYGITDAFDGDYNSLTNTPTIPTVIGDLTNVSTATPSTGQVLKWDGSQWAPGTDLTASGGTGITLADLSVSNATPNGSTSSLAYNNTTGVFTFTPAASSGGATSLSGLTDVYSNINPTQGGETLIWDAVNNYWTNSGPAVAPQNTIDDLADVTVTSTSDGQFLVYNNASGEWENKTVDVADLTDVGGLLTQGGGSGSGISLSDLSVTTAGSPQGLGSLQYSNQTGVFTFTQPDIASGSRTALSVTTAAASAGGSLVYNSGTGVFTFTPPDMTTASATAGGSTGQVQFNNSNAFAGDAKLTFSTSGDGTLSVGSNGGGRIKTNYWVGTDNTVQPMYIQSDNGSGSKATHVVFTNSGGAQTTTFSGAVNFTGTTIQGIELTDLTGISDGTAGQVLTTDGNGGFTFTTVSGGGSSFSGSYNDLTDKPTIPSDVNQLSDASGLLTHNVYTQGTGIQINSNVVSLNAALGQLNNVSASAPALGQVLGWSGSQWEPTTPSGGANLSSSSINELNDVDTTGIQSGQFLEWDGTKFVAASGGTVDLSTESIGDLGDVSNSTPNNGDVLTWNGTANNWEPQAASSGGGGGGGSVEYFKLNYATNGSLSSISNATSGVSATIVDANSGETDITFSGYSFPPSNVLIYGYSRLTNEYIIMPLNKDIATRTLAGGGSPGSPVAFGTLGSLTLSLTLREADTGANRSFGTDTHAWIVISMI